MKISKLSLLLFILLLTSFLSGAQCGSVQYESLARKSFWKNHIETLRSEGKFDAVTGAKEMVLAIENQAFELLFSGSKSYFCGTTVEPEDLLGTSLTRWYIASALTNAKELIYYNSTSHHLSKIVPQGTGFVEIVDSSFKHRWQIDPDTTKIIKGYLCLRATYIDTISGSTGQDIVRTHEAWFTPDIPVSYGPTTFVGLPGLVLSAGTLGGRYFYVVSKLDIKESECEDRIPTPPRTLQTYSLKEWQVYNEALAAKRRKY